MPKRDYLYLYSIITCTSEKFVSRHWCRGGGHTTRCSLTCLLCWSHADRVDETGRRLMETERELAETGRKLAEMEISWTRTKCELAETIGRLAESERGRIAVRNELAGLEARLADTFGCLAEAERKLAAAERRASEAERQLADGNATDSGDDVNGEGTTGTDAELKRCCIRAVK